MSNDDIRMSSNSRYSVVCILGHDSIIEMKIETSSSNRLFSVNWISNNSFVLNGIVRERLIPIADRSLGFKNIIIIFAGFEKIFSGIYFFSRRRYYIIKKKNEFVDL